MSAALEPITRQRLEQFRRRQQMLQAVRGLALAMIFAFAVLLFVVAIDAGWVIGQTVRWLLSLAIYATLLGWLAVTSRRVTRPVSLPTTARVLEQLEPLLQQRLLAAVELSQDQRPLQYTSAGFRELIQRQVALAVAPVNAQLLLPWSMLVRVLLLALLCMTILIGLSFVPGLHWPHRVTRALLPGANLGRITQFQIEIVSPRPATTMMPSGDVAAIEARVSGPLPDIVQLETRIDGLSDTLSMRRVFDSPNRDLRSNPRVNNGAINATAIQMDSSDVIYAVNLQLGPQTVEYRIIVEDAHTPWHRLTTRARPQVNEFHKTILYPTYSGLADAQVSSIDGDIEALKGSRVRLEIVCDQPIRHAALQISLPDLATPKTIPMVSTGNPQEARFVAELPVDGDSTYRIELVAAETNFTNAFSRAYQIRALDDMPPKLVWEEPETSLLVVEPNQLVPMTIHVEDELPLGELMIVSSINGELPTSVAIQTPQAADSSVKCELDLMALKPQLGDTVRVLFQAIDRQGQSTASTPVELVISSTSVDPDRRPATEQRIEIASELRKFSEQIQPQAKRIRNLQEQFIKSQSDADLSELQQAGAQMAEQARSLAGQLREKVAAYLKQPQDSVSLAELERTGQVLARIESEIAKELSATSARLDSPLPVNPSGDERDKVDPLRERANRTRSSSDKLSDAVGVIDRRFREFVAHDVLAEVARGISVVQGFQRQLAIRSDEIPPAQLKRRQTVVARQLRELEQIMIDRSPLLREGASHGLRGWIEWSGQLAERIERAAADRDENPNFKEFTKQIANEVDAHQSVMNVDGGLAGEINNGRKDLDARSLSASHVLQDLVKAMSGERLVGDGRMDDAWKELVATGLDHLQHRKELQQARSDSDPHHSSDLGNAIRATKLLVERQDSSLAEVAQRLAATTGALKQLEAIHNVNEAHKHLSDLEQIERWDSNSVDARTESPRAWDALQQRLEQSSRALREAGIDGKLADELDTLRMSNPSAEASQKIGDRRWTGETRVSAERELIQMRAQLDSTRAKLDAIASAARAELNGYAPSVSDLARRAAGQTRQLEQQTRQLSKAAAAEEVPDLKSRMDQLTAQQKETAAPMEDLRDALTEMAAMQDLLEDDQRSLARDADTSQQIIDKANEQVAQSLEPAAKAESPGEAAEPLEKAATTQGEASQALEQIADHFDKMKSSDLPEGELADSRMALKKLASDLDMASMEQWYKTAESLAKLAGTDPEKVMKRLEDELKGNARMREELSDIAKRAVNESVQSLNFSADQERTLQSQLELSDPNFFVRKSLLQTDIHAAAERIRELMQQLSNDASSVAGRANARDQQRVLSELQQLVQSAVAKASTARESLPLEELQHVALAVLVNLTTAQEEFGSASEKLMASSDEITHSSDQELRNRKREMEDWERRTIQQQARGAQAIERSHDQRVRQAENDVKRFESSLRNAQRQREEIQKQLDQKPDSNEIKRRMAESDLQIRSVEGELRLAEIKRQSLKDRLDTAKQAHVEISTRKPNELGGKNPTAELAGRLANNAATTASVIAKELKQALADAQWMNQLEAAHSQLQSAGKTQTRVEQSVQDVADNLHRAARHESRMEHPQSAAQIVSQADKVEEARKDEVHTANDRLASANQHAQATATPETPGRASAEASLAARGAMSDAEDELRERVRDLKNMLERPKADEAAGEEKEIPMDAKTSVPLDPKMLARMLDELDRQMTETSSQQPEEGEKSPPNPSADAGKSQDENNASSSQQSSPSGKKQGSQTASMQEAAQQLAQQMNRQRAQGRQSTAASRMSSNSADTKAAPPSAVRVLSVDRRAGEDWGKLREQAAEQTVESARQTIAPQYRQSVETYFRVLSERGQKASQP